MILNGGKLLDTILFPICFLFRTSHCPEFYIYDYDKGEKTNSIFVNLIVCENCEITS